MAGLHRQVWVLHGGESDVKHASAAESVLHYCYKKSGLGSGSC